MTFIQCHPTADTGHLRNLPLLREEETVVAILPLITLQALIWISPVFPLLPSFCSRSRVSIVFCCHVSLETLVL